MGARRTAIAPIVNSKQRRVTFAKRKNGLMKKAWELSVLCSAECLIVLRDVRGRVFRFSASFKPETLAACTSAAGGARLARTREPTLLAPRPHDGDPDEFIARIAAGRAGPIAESRLPAYYDRGNPPTANPADVAAAVARGLGAEEEHEEEEEDEEPEEDDDDDEFDDEEDDEAAPPAAKSTRAAAAAGKKRAAPAARAAAAPAKGRKRKSSGTGAGAAPITASAPMLPTLTVTAPPPVATADLPLSHSIFASNVPLTRSGSLARRRAAAAAAAAAAASAAAANAHAGSPSFHPSAANLSLAHAIPGLAPPIKHNISRVGRRKVSLRRRTSARTAAAMAQMHQQQQYALHHHQQQQQQHHQQPFYPGSYQGNGGAPGFGINPLPAMTPDGLGLVSQPSSQEHQIDSMLALPNVFGSAPTTSVPQIVTSAPAAEPRRPQFDEANLRAEAQLVANYYANQSGSAPVVRGDQPAATGAQGLGRRGTIRSASGPLDRRPSKRPRTSTVPPAASTSGSGSGGSGDHMLGSSSPCFALQSGCNSPGLSTPQHHHLGVVSPSGRLPSPNMAHAPLALPQQQQRAYMHQLATQQQMMSPAFGAANDPQMLGPNAAASVTPQILLSPAMQPGLNSPWAGGVAPQQQQQQGIVSHMSPMLLATTSAAAPSSTTPFMGPTVFGTTPRLGPQQHHQVSPYLLPTTGGAVSGNMSLAPSPFLDASAIMQQQQHTFQSHQQQQPQQQQQQFDMSPFVAASTIPTTSAASYSSSSGASSTFAIPALTPAASTAPWPAEHVLSAAPTGDGSVDYRTASLDSGFTSVPTPSGPATTHPRFPPSRSESAASTGFQFDLDGFDWTGTTTGSPAPMGPPPPTSSAAAADATAPAAESATHSRSASTDTTFRWLMSPTPAPNEAGAAAAGAESSAAAAATPAATGFHTVSEFLGAPQQQQPQQQQQQQAGESMSS
ncbi:K-box region [Blastocladiella emersonii ATCC 22665]|nr:K-box region [Blastocladiella emersonii ATCC 22665]